MKIAYFTHGFPYRNPLTGELIRQTATGGVQYFAYHLARTMAQRGHEVEIHTTADGSEDTRERYGNIEIIRYRKDFTIELTPISLKFVTEPITAESDADIFHAHFGTPHAALSAYLFAHKTNKPLIISYLGDNIAEYGGALRRLSVGMANRFLNDFLLSRCDQITVLSPYNLNGLSYITQYRDKITVLPNGIDMEDFAISASKEECRRKLGLPLQGPIILFVGSLVPVKAPHVLLEAMKTVVETVPDAFLIMAGEGPLRNDLEKQSKRLGIEKSVYFPGYVSAEKPMFYRSADIFVLPSISEGFPTVVLEASAASLPMVLSNLDGLRGIVTPGHDCLFARKGDAAHFAGQIISLLKDSGIRETIGQNAYQNAQQFTWNDVAARAEMLYAHIREEHT